MTTHVSRDDILRRRVRSQLADGSGQSVVEVVRHMLAMQAQDFAQAQWAVATRAKGSVRTDLLDALDAGSVVRTLPMRGTLHFVPAEDLRWTLRVTSARTLSAAATRFRGLGLDSATLEQSAEIVQAALEGGGRVDRAGFMALLGQHGIATDGQRGYHIIFYLCQREVLCWGPPAAVQQFLVLVDEWIGPSRVLDREDALREFAIRYFRGHGPATIRDFAWWTKLTLADARAAVAAAGTELAACECDGVSYLASSDQWDAPASAFPRGVQLLAGFDEFLLGYEDRSLTLRPEHSGRIVPGSNGIFLPTVIARGRVVGTWRRVPKSRDIPIEPEWFESATPADVAAFGTAAKRYARFAATRAATPR